jgi:hypothetical protein
MRKVFLTLWVWLKCFTARLLWWIGDVDKEKDFIKSAFPGIPTLADMEAQKIRYIPDRVFGFIPWDYQFDSRMTFYRGGGDCNSLHRIIQVAAHNAGLEAYLVTYLAKPFILSHTTCIIREGRDWWVLDYGEKTLKSATIGEAISKCAEKYGSRLAAPGAWVIQDINWHILQ